MRQLDTCDFCGGAAEGVFEVVPAAVADGPVRLALCADCRSTLQIVVDPLLDADGTDQHAGTDGDQPAGRDGEQSSAPVSGDATGQDATDEDATDEDASAGGADDAPEDAGSDRRRASRSSTDDDGVTIQPSGDSPAGNEGDEDGNENEDDEDAGAADRRPRGYGQVLRLLQNRDGAMPREDLRALASNAYDVPADAVEDAVDAAVENGELEETAGGLRTT